MSPGIFWLYTKGGRNWKLQRKEEAAASFHIFPKFYHLILFVFQLRKKATLNRKTLS